MKIHIESVVNKNGEIYLFLFEQGNFAKPLVILNLVEAKELTEAINNEIGEIIKKAKKGITYVES